jgi:hypothetical protein
MNRVGQIIKQDGWDFLVKFIDTTEELFKNLKFADPNDYGTVSQWILLNEENVAEIISNPYKPLYDGRASIRYVPPEEIRSRRVIEKTTKWYRDGIWQIQKSTNGYFPKWEIKAINNSKSWIDKINFYDKNYEPQMGDWIWNEFLHHENAPTSLGGAFKIPSPYHIPEPVLVKYWATPSEVLR